MTGRAAHADDDAVVDELAYTLDGVFSRATIAQAVADARVRLEPSAKVTTFLPVLVHRFAREQLTAAGPADRTVAHPVPEVLFVCVHNAGRSQLAAALASHLSGGRVHVRSGGSVVRDVRNQIQGHVTALLRDLNI